MKFDIITIFPEAFDSYLNTSLLARAQGKGIIDVNVFNLRDYATGVHRTVDDRPYGGGAGMVIKVDVVARALKAILPRRKRKTRVILLSASGKTFTQRHAESLAKKYDHLIFLSGRYEGFDTRVENLVDEEISIGDYILTGGELPALVVIDAVSRLVPGVVGKMESTIDESFAKSNQILEYPHYTRPEVWKLGKKKYAVPKILRSGNHAAIAKWRGEQAHKRTKKRRPDLLSKAT